MIVPFKILFRSKGPRPSGKLSKRDIVGLVAFLIFIVAFCVGFAVWILPAKAQLGNNEAVTQISPGVVLQNDTDQNVSQFSAGVILEQSDLRNSKQFNPIIMGLDPTALANSKQFNLMILENSILANSKQFNLIVLDSGRFANAKQFNLVVLNVSAASTTSPVLRSPMTIPR